MGLRFGFDIGIASVGVAVVDDNYDVKEAISYIFPAAEASENVSRRSFRQMKRLHRRKVNRLNDFNKLWIKYGYKIPDIKINEVIELKVRALSQEISMDELYAVLHHSLKMRGISYLEDAIDENGVKGDYQRGIVINQKELEEKEYPCEIQFERLRKYGSYRGENTVEIDGEKVTLSNVFTTGAYKKELEVILNKQAEFHKEISEDFKKDYLEIFTRKREYFVGPGNELSRTDYGKYTTKKDAKGNYINEDNIFEKLIGKCSINPDETRAAAASYSAQEFNLLNDLNNLTVNERKLSEEEKRKIIDIVKNSNSVNMEKIIKKVIGEDIYKWTGFRVDKNDKPEFHTFKQYNLIRKALEEIGVDIQDFDRDTLDNIACVLTINTDKETILKGFDRKNIELSDEVKKVLISVRKKNSSYFNKWHSFGLTIINELIEPLYKEPKNQMELLTNMGYFKPDVERYKDYNSVPVNELLDNIYNPVVTRAVRITIKALNALIKKYGYPDEVVIEMPRDKNSDEEKKRIDSNNKANAKELDEIVKKIKLEYGIEISESTFYKHKGLVMKLKLWNEQGGKCLYSGKTIDVKDLINNFDMFEIDHVIPKSISFDDSRNNKVLVYRTENQNKGNMTPFMYLSTVNRDWDYDKYKEYIKSLGYSRNKRKNLFFEEDITKMEVLQGFINRNLNDTRYASKVVLNTLQSFFRAKDVDTKIKVIRGSFTHMMRVNLRLDKDRDESYSHHAVDAMLMCYAQMGYEAYRKLNHDIVDYETGEILDEKELIKSFDDDKFDDLLYQDKWMNIKNGIKKAEQNVKFWFKKDTKVNRGLCNQTIYGTREVDGKTIKVNYLNIYTKDGYKRLLNLIKKGKQEDFLMYRNDPKTWENLMTILEDYKDSANAFVEYEKETGDCLRKYSKKHNGPRIEKIKYLDNEVNSCIDISHKYGFKKNSKKVILESLNPYRTDVYYDLEKKIYYLIGIKYSDIIMQHGEYYIDEKKYNELLIKEGAELNRINTDIVFKFSLYKNDIVRYEKNGEIYVERFLSRSLPNKKGYIETKPLEKPKFEKQNLKGVNKSLFIEKINLDDLGNQYKSVGEKFSLKVDM